MKKPTSTRSDELSTDALLIGGGIMSATLAAMLTELHPTWRVTVVERADTVATESSDPWNNAGTGHSGFCELNYMPDPTDGSTPAEIADGFSASRAWWARMNADNVVDSDEFLTHTPHLDVVFGDRDVTYLRARYRTLRRLPQFAEMEYTEDPETIAQWAPLLMAGRDHTTPMAATRHPNGTDVDFGELTRQLLSAAISRGARVIVGHEVRRLRRDGGDWVAHRRRGSSGPQRIRARFVFVGAGGMALRLLQSSGIREVRGYGVLPVGAAFLRCANPEVVSQHESKVYGQADIGAPPMSVPHLDRRRVGGRDYLMFGPYATFSTALLKNGSWRDFFTTLRWHNLPVLAAAAVTNLSLVRYLIGQVLAGDDARLAQLRRYYPAADGADWEYLRAGQRAQLVTPDRRRIGALRTGTELVVSADASIAGLLGASPGASTAVPIMTELLQRCFGSRAVDEHVQPGDDVVGDQQDVTTGGDVIAVNE